MRVGLVTKWFNRGQPVVARQLRSALDELGHETYVLARPKKERGPMKGRLQRDDVWDQPRVDEASAYDVTAAEYSSWVERRGIQVIFPGGFVGHRKPIEPVVDAFMRTRDERLRLLVKAQVERKGGAATARAAAAGDARIKFMLSDQPTGDHLREFASADVCLAPA